MNRLRSTIIAGLLLVLGRCALSDVQHIDAAPPTVSDERRPTELIVVKLHPAARVQGRIVQLSDVAVVTGGDASVREELMQLDLEEILQPGESVLILPPQIEFRLRIAGIDVDQISIRGRGVRVSCPTGSNPVRADNMVKTVANSSASSKIPKRRPVIDFGTFSSDESPLERKVVKAARDCILNKLPWPAEDIDIRLAQPVSREIRQVESAADYECSAEIRSSSTTVGRVQVRVIAESPTQNSFDVSVMLEVRHFDKVVLTTKAIERGHVMTAEDLYVDRQDVTEMTDYSSNPKTLIGCTAKRAVRALLPIRKNEIELVSRAEGGILIKRRERVKMIAQVGGVSVTATGEAQQDGRLGDTIPLKNVDSNSNVRGRVTGANEVEIQF